MKSTHSARIETWLGPEQVASISRNMNQWYGPPIAVHGIPGSVYATGDGDFIGEINAGSEASHLDRANDILRKERRNRYWRMGLSKRQSGAFSNLSGLIAAATGGKAQSATFFKTGVASNAIGNANDLWTRVGQPTAGAAGAAAATGTSPTSASTGALNWANPANSNTGHFVSGAVTASVVNNTLLLYDRLFAVAKTMNSTGTEAVSGTFSRYQSQTATASDYIGGNFCFPANPTTVLAATAHNWTVCKYTNQGGTTGQTFPSAVGVSACVVGGVDLVAQQWFMRLASGDVGVKALSQMQCDASVATGTIDFVVGHPIAFFPCPIANMVCVVDGVYTAFNLTNVYDNACLTFLEMPKPATTATTYSGIVQFVAE